MKNILITSLILGTFLFPSFSHAQVTGSATTAQVEELKNTLIALLTQMIADLQRQIAVLIAQQEQAALAITDVNNKVTETSARVEVVESQTAPATGSTESVAPAPTLSATTICAGGMRAVKIEAMGEYKFATINVGETTNYTSGELFTKNVSPYPYVHRVVDQINNYKIVLTNVRTDGPNANYAILAETSGQPDGLNCN